jgi:bacillithiol biosynthesis deacetylase BshB1
MVNPTAVDLLAFGPHPDDIEIGLGGAVANQVDLGCSVGLCDLTRGELGSNGTVDERKAEANRAAAVLGAAWRLNLGWPDGGVGRPDLKQDQVRAAAELIRASRPRTVAVPYWRDRHPDHEAASVALTEAVFRAGLRRYPADGDAWKPDWTCYYFINDMAPPSFVIDVTAAYERKRAALACHSTQFRPSGDEAVETRLTGTGFLGMIEARDAHFGAQVGTQYAEGVVVKSMLVRRSLMKS